jgi:hypothetical protein
MSHQGRPGIRIEDGLTLRFPGRDGSFRAGVEIGMLATLMAMRIPRIVHSISGDNLDQARALAAKLGYYLHSLEPEADGMFGVAFGSERPRPRLHPIGRRD